MENGSLGIDRWTLIKEVVYGFGSVQHNRFAASSVEVEDVTWSAVRRKGVASHKLVISIPYCFAQAE
jgi:hypothetical protein